ncbi:MAG: DUF2007 domain-containing protein [Ignavibacteria bacterium]|nr:DUF2007 domain-containing protein [Ignavibacteria bacterium]
MPYCPECKSEYIEGVTRCSDCEVDLVDVLNEDEHFSPENYKLIFQSSQVIEAEMLKSNLESAGIEAYILNQTDRSYVGFNNTGLVKVFVNISDENDAEEFLKNYETSENNVNPEENTGKTE